MIIFSNIIYYSTASTSEAAYIIGGYPITPRIIAEFRRNSWRLVGTLAKGRNTHGSITLNGETMVIGGDTDRG